MCETPTLVLALFVCLRARDPGTARHSRRVARLAYRLGRAMGLSDPECARLFHAGLLHDIGKLAINCSTLHKTSTLDPAERRHIQTHVARGVWILGHFPELFQFIPLVATHHEQVGTSNGYPAGVQGEAIPLGGRILAICDVYDAVRNTRSYKKAVPTRQAIAVLEKGRDERFDGQVLDVFIEMIRPRHRVGVSSNGNGRSST